MATDISVVIKLVDELSKRVDAIQGQWYEYWIPVSISLIALGTSILGFFQNRNQSKSNVLQGIKNNVDLAKSQFESKSMEVASLKSKSQLTEDEKKEVEIKNQVIESILERLLNAYNDGCDKFYKKRVVKQDFVDMYDKDIALYIESFPDKFQAPVTRFEKMIDYYNEYHKHKKA